MAKRLLVEKFLNSSTKKTEMSMPRFKLEDHFEIHDNKTHESLEIGPDREGLGLLEFRVKNEKNNVTTRFTFHPDQAPLMIEALTKLWSEKQTLSVLEEEHAQT